jgi:PHD/YefM family antitoxin component YafN of YafNO toxin-antitoxin module
MHVLEIAALIEPEEPDTTEYLLSTEANRQHLMRALKDAEDSANYRVVATDDL